jgi:hypothetical protein
VKVAVCLFFAIAFVGTQQTVWTANTLVSQWKLDEGTGTTTRDTVASRTATLTNGATWTTGKGSAAVSLDGSNDYIKLPSLDVTGSKLTLMAWVKHSSWATGVAQRFISKAVDSSEAQSYWTIGQTNNGQNRLFFRLKSGNVTRTLIASSGTLPLNTWYHVAATYDGTKMRLYLNGTEVGSMAKSGYVARSSTVPVAIGRSPEGSNYLRGAIDDVRIYSSAVSAYDISRVVAAASSTVAPTNKAPTVSLSSPAAGASFAAGTTVTVSATAADTDGTIARVQFYDGSTLIGSDTSSPYSVSWPSVAAGSHTLKAVATDNKGATTTSATRTVTATTTSGSNTPPAVSLTAPSAGAVFNIGLSITLSATASDSNGSVTRVDFYRDSTLIGTDTTSPYSVIWLNAPLGNYALTAVARDNAGAMTVSSTRDITVKSATLPTKAVFTPSSNHATAVDRYVLEVFTAGANTTVANPVATRDLGKPAIVSGSISVDISSTILALSPGNYVATVTAVGDVGSTQSAASPQFTR